jgi:DNA helicase-2/ATP-dependent DNA helicase PcrA
MTQQIIKYFGPPGTGKTTKLRSIVEQEVKAGTPLPRIAYLSFTKGAAEVIRERMGASEADVKWFRTIHSACMSLLGIGRDSVVGSQDYRQFRVETGIDIRGDEFDDWDLEKPLDFTPAKRALELATATQTDIFSVIKTMPPHMNLTQSRVEMFLDKWNAFKRDNHLFDFTDMLTRYLSEDTDPLPVDVIILDEAQDLSLLQWAVFHKLARAASRVYMAGDDDQAIYGFIGGSEYGFLDHASNEEHVISKSWRVPRAIGERADEIIRKVSHRKQKEVKWMDKEGELRRMNLDAFTLPWRTYMERYDSIMVLTRHRKGARSFSDDLKAVGVPHDVNGEGLSAWPEARLIHTYFELKAGKKVTIKQAKKLLDELDLNADMLKGLKPRDKIDFKTLPAVDWNARTWVGTFAGGNQTKLKRYEAIRQLVNQDGHEALVRDPKVRVKTMHAAKGDEAELIVIVPECTSIVRRNIMTPAEIRLAYVTTTRAKRDAIILTPRSDNYITHFFGG